MTIISNNVSHNSQIILVIPKILCYVLPRISILNEPLQTTNYTQKSLLNCFIVCQGYYLLKNSCNKVPGLLFIFVHIYVWVTPIYKTTRYAFPGSHGVFQL